MTYSNLGESNSGVIHVIALHGSNQYLSYVLYSMHPKKPQNKLETFYTIYYFKREQYFKQWTNTVWNYFNTCTWVY